MGLTSNILQSQINLSSFGPNIQHPNMLSKLKAHPSLQSVFYSRLYTMTSIILVFLSLVLVVSSASLTLSYIQPLFYLQLLQRNPKIIRKFGWKFARFLGPYCRMILFFRLLGPCAKKKKKLLILKFDFFNVFFIQLPSFLN